MRRIKIATCILGLAISTASIAHVGLKQASPAQDAMLMQSPSNLSLTFSDKVRLIKLSINADNQTPVEFGFKANADAGTMYEWPLPTFAAGTYGVNWVALGEDGHKISGQYQFTLHGQGMMNDMPMEDTSHNAHKH